MKIIQFAIKYLPTSINSILKHLSPTNFQLKSDVVSKTVLHSVWSRVDSTTNFMHRLIHLVGPSPLGLRDFPQGAEHATMGALTTPAHLFNHPGLRTRVEKKTNLRMPTNQTRRVPAKGWYKRWFPFRYNRLCTVIISKSIYCVRWFFVVIFPWAAVRNQQRIFDNTISLEHCRIKGKFLKNVVIKFLIE